MLNGIIEQKGSWDQVINAIEFMSECLFPSKISCYKNSKLKVKTNIQEYVLWTMHSKTGWKWVLVLDVSIYQGVSEEAGLWHNGLGETRGWDWGCPHFPPISLLLRRQWWPTKCATKEQFKAQRVALTSHQYRRHWEDSKRFNHQCHCYWYRSDGKRFYLLQVRHGICQKFYTPRFSG